MNAIHIVYSLLQKQGYEEQKLHQILKHKIELIVLSDDFLQLHNVWMVQLAEWLLRQPTHVRSVYTSSQPLTKKIQLQSGFQGFLRTCIETENLLEIAATREKEGTFKACTKLTKKLSL
jgi:hypothetical protein